MGHLEPARAEGNLDFVELADVIYTLLCVVWGENWGRLVMDRPLLLDAKDIEFPIITFQLKEQVPGAINKQGDRERTPRVRHQHCTTDQDGKPVTLTDQGQRMDGKMVFKVYGNSNKEAIQLSEGFMDVIQRFKGVLLKKGLQNIWFEKEEEHLEEVRETVYSRKITYHVTFEKIFKDVNPNIEEILIAVDTLYDQLAKDGKLPTLENK